MFYLFVTAPRRRAERRLLATTVLVQCNQLGRVLLPRRRPRPLRYDGSMRRCRRGAPRVWRLLRALLSLLGWRLLGSSSGERCEAPRVALARLGDACASVVVLLAATLMMAAFSGGPCSFCCWSCPSPQRPPGVRSRRASASAHQRAQPPPSTRWRIPCLTYQTQAQTSGRTDVA